MLKSSAQIVPFWPDIGTAAGDGNVVVTRCFAGILRDDGPADGHRSLGLSTAVGTGHGCGLLIFLAPGFASGAVLTIDSRRTRRRARRGGDRARGRVAWYLALSADAVCWSSSVRVGGLS